MAAHLLAFGIVAGGRIDTIGNHNAHWIVADFESWIANYISMPIYPTVTETTMRKVLVQSETHRHAVRVAAAPFWQPAGSNRSLLWNFRGIAANAGNKNPRVN